MNGVSPDPATSTSARDPGGGPVGRRVRCAALLLALAAGSSPAAVAAGSEAAPAPNGIAAFSRHARFGEVRVSPRGTHLAVIGTEDGRRSLMFFDLATRRQISGIRPDANSMIGDFRWVNDDRVVAEVLTTDGSLALPRRTGEIYAVSADGHGGRLVFGYRAGEMQAGSHIRRGEPDAAAASILARLRGDDRHVLIAAVPFWEQGDRSARLYRLDVYSGVKDEVCTAPIRNASFLTDENGEARISWGDDARVRRRFFYREPGGPWRELATLPGLTPRSVPRGFVSRDRTLYVEEPGNTGFALYAVDLDRGERRVLSRNDLVPATQLVKDHITGRAIAVEYEPDVPVLEFLEPEHPLGRALRGLLATFPDDHVRVLNTTDDGKKAVVVVYSDRNPGQYLLLDVDKGSAETLLEARPWIHPGDMAAMEAFHITASDGLRIHGYVTRPTTSGGSPPPLVVLPHGGPHFVRDHWAFDPEVQLLASHGFAVLQVNYRGSGGYGDAYQSAGFRHWGDRVIQDILDATQWAIHKGYADPTRICVYGASFGGYAALQSAVLAPHLFRCAVGYAGVYDLALMHDTGDVAERRLGRGYLDTVVGTQPAALRAMSPASDAERVRARVLLVHGEMDERVPVEHAHRMREALTAAGRPPAWILEPKEAHGFYDEGARERMYAALLRFVEENTRPASPSPPPPH
ncbi:MAG TPA: S9 family peptidase [Anaeromyxobacteraceae bacterium]|nr:S9 family peptidase [Anaeromyxobacteraceae bacterium]